MASKEALFLTLDVSPTMSAHLPSLRAALASHLTDLALHSRSDVFGLSLFNSLSTCNKCHESMGGYDNITIEGDIGPVGEKRIRQVCNIEGQGAEGADAVDALVVASDALASYVRKLKFGKRIMLVTDGECVSAELDEDQMGQIVSQLVETEMRLEIVTLGAMSTVRAAAEAGRDVQPELQTTAAVWATLSALGERMRSLARERGVQRQLFSVCTWEELRAKWSEPFIKRTRATVSYRGGLNIAGAHLPVRVFKKVASTSGAPVKFNFVSKEAVACDAKTGANDSGAPARSGYFEEKRFFQPDDRNADVPPEDRISACRYGRDLIPLSASIEESMKYGVAEKCFELHGFVPQSAVPRHFFLTTTDVVVGDDTTLGAHQAISALCIAMEDAGVGAIARYAPKAKSAPRLALLLPGIKCLYLNQLPFREEVKSLLWPPPKHEPPNEAQRTAAEALVDALDLDAEAHRRACSSALPDQHDLRICEMPPEARAILRRPKDIHNPAHQRYYEILKHGLLHPSEPAPPSKGKTVAPLQPDDDLFATARPALATFADACPVGPMLKHSGKRAWKEIGMEDGAPTGQQRRLDTSESSSSSVPALPSLEVSGLVNGSGSLRVDSGRPVETFWRMLQDADDSRMLEAVAQMEQVTIDLMAQAARPDDAAGLKAYRCLRELRRACVQQAKPQLYNTFLERLRDLWMPAVGSASHARESFWRVLATDADLSKGKISCDETEASSVTAREAREFLTRAVAPNVLALAAPEKHAAMEDDDFDDLE